jgi:hypothetical protein
MRNEFFLTDVFYSPDPLGPQDYTLLVLAVKFEGRSHTTIWTNTSRDAPAGLVSIVRAIQVIASK